MIRGLRALWFGFCVCSILCLSEEDNSMDEGLLSLDGKDIGEPSFLEQQILDAQSNVANEYGASFSCSLNSNNAASTSVHTLRPSDIRVIGALGDSLTAGNGINATRLIGVATEYRQLVFSIGGAGTLNSSVTLPNILKLYRKDLIGYATGEGPVWRAANSHLDVAVPGAKAEDLLDQAKRLVSRMKADGNIDLERDWKMLTLFIGANNLCQFCNNTQQRGNTGRRFFPFGRNGGRNGRRNPFGGNGGRGGGPFSGNGGGSDPFGRNGGRGNGPFSRNGGRRDGGPFGRNGAARDGGPFGRNGGGRDGRRNGGGTRSPFGPNGRGGSNPFRPNGGRDNNGRGGRNPFGRNGRGERRSDFGNRQARFQEDSDQFVNNVRETLDYLSANLKRTYLNLITPPDVTTLRPFNDAYPYCQWTHSTECPCLEERNWFTNEDEIEQQVQSYYGGVRAMLADFHSENDRDDFAVVLQPLLEHVEVPFVIASDGTSKPDRTYLAPDCFHFSQKMEVAVARHLWNQMLTPVQEKSGNFTIKHATAPLNCPNSECPYFRTDVNSVNCSVPESDTTQAVPTTMIDDDTTAIEWETTTVEGSGESSDTPVVKGDGPNVLMAAQQGQSSVKDGQSTSAALTVGILMAVVILVISGLSVAHFVRRKRSKRASNENTPLLQAMIYDEDDQIF